MVFRTYAADTDSTFYLFLDFWCRYRHHFLTFLTGSHISCADIDSTFYPFLEVWCTYQAYFSSTFDSFDEFLNFVYRYPQHFFNYFFAVWCRYRHHFLTVSNSSMNPPVALSYPFDWFSVFWCRYRHHFLPTSVTHVHLTTVLVHTIVYNRVRTRCTIRCSYSTSTVQ